VEPQRILDVDGTLVGTVPDGLDEAHLHGMMRLMLIGRRLDQKAIALQRRGKLGTYAPLSGQEAASVGSSFAMDTSSDRLVPQYREQLAMLHWGLPLGTYLLQRYGASEGCRAPGARAAVPAAGGAGGPCPPRGRAGLGHEAARRAGRGDLPLR
jgi:pyruvate dehydrogenase E1 component alpha subunit